MRDGGPDPIELIPADPDAFAPAVDRPPVARDRRLRGGSVPALTAVVVALLATAGVVGTSLRPWERTGRVLRFPVAPRQLGTLDGRLVFDAPPGELSAAGLGTGDAVLVAPSAGVGAAGYFFASTDAHYGFVRDTGDGAWAQFVVDAGQSDLAPTGASSATVQGAPAEIVHGGSAIEIAFGPVDGRSYLVTTHRLSPTAALRFAEAVTIDDGAPAITDDRALGTLQPVGNLDEFWQTMAVLTTAILPSGPWRDVVHARYSRADAVYSIASTPIDRNDMASLLRYFLPDSTPATVHGQPAIVAVVSGLDRTTTSTDSVTLVAWVEGGRLVVVSGPGEATATLALAESVRAATADEWAAVQDLADRISNGR